MRMNQFIFGNSLINFAEGNNRTNLPFWIDRMADTAGHVYRMEGGFGFLRNFADQDEPNAQWGFNGVSPAYRNGRNSFDEVSFDSIIIAPANFIQENGPRANYPGDGRSPLDAMLDIVRNVDARQPGAQITIYEGWADMDPYGGPTNGYYAYNRGAYHNWYENLADQVNAAAPRADVSVIPVASVMADLFTDTVLRRIADHELYVDSAPHGTETIYALAAMITYSAIFGEAPPAGLSLPTSIAAELRGNYGALRLEIHERTQARMDGIGAGGPVDPPTEPEGPEPQEPPEPGGGTGEYHASIDTVIEVDASGRHIFRIRSSEEAALLIDGEILIDNDGGRARKGTFLSEGTHTVTVWQPDDTATARLVWWERGEKAFRQRIDADAFDFAAAQDSAASFLPPAVPLDDGLF